MIIDELCGVFKDQNIAVAFVYLDYQDRQHQTHIRVLRCLLKQLVTQRQKLPSFLGDLYDESMRGMTNLDALTLLAQFYSCAKEYDSVYLFFDAFDECGADQHESMLSTMSELLRQPSVKIIIATRHLLHRLQTISENALTIQIEARDDDLQQYLWSRLEKPTYPSRGLKKEIVDVITQGAEGM